jgi:hypothetical protein
MSSRRTARVRSNHTTSDDGHNLAFSGISSVGGPFMLKQFLLQLNGELVKEEVCLAVLIVGLVT